MRSWRRCRENWTAGRRVWRKYVRCHRWQHPGHITRHYRAPESVSAWRRKTSVVASSAPEGYAKDSAVPTVAVELGTRSNGVDRKGVLSRTDTSSDAAAVSQVSSNKPRDQRCRARRKATSPQSPHEMPDPEDPQTRFAAVSFHLPLTNSVPQVELVQSCVCQSIAASAICDASQQEAPRCVSTARVRKSDSPPLESSGTAAGILCHAGRLP